MRLRIEGINQDQRIPERFAFGIPDRRNHVSFGENLNPAISWGDLPEGTRSLVLICVDTDVPTSPDDVNKENRLVPASLPRGRFYHWVMVDIPPTVEAIAEGACSKGVTTGGKRRPPGPEGARQGRNDYTDWFDGDEDMQGTYLGYDGPCPPWNDSIPHHYHFILRATDLERCPVEGAFSGGEVEQVIDGHVLSEVRITGLYSLNPDIAI